MASRILSKFKARIL